ncbi:MAG: FIST C-terminal domain-containing protein [Desulfomonile tiedjei]|uniref:FIST C-terminal domain-containing protein n=1 Tax=Desulfomonile tiedjei TaxID=2358 RepID=A0A9D6UXX7_9BACT|nr:FIST C-terminal domain-containing protein [Desulfomonile tiedjei]
MFKAATVSSKEPFSSLSGEQLGNALLGELGRAPSACWLFSTPSQELKELVSGVSRAMGDVDLVGCTTDGEVSMAGLSTGSAVLCGVTTDRIEFHVACVENLHENTEEAGRRLAKQFPSTVRYVQIFSDGLTGNGCAILRGMTSVLGSHVPIAGGTAGDAGAFQKTWQFFASEALSDAVVGIGFSGDFTVGTGVRSGWSPIGIAKRVTRACGNVVHELNGQPALEVYERFLGKHADKLPSVGVEYPLGLVCDGGDHGKEDFHLLRATMSVNRNDGSIVFAGEIPEGSMVRLTCGDHASILGAAEQAAISALGELGNRTPAMAFFYSCMARKIVLGRRTREEVDRIRLAVGTDLPIVGFYTYGEYCRIKANGPSLLHNETASVSVIGL